MLDNAKGLLDMFKNDSKHPAMAMLDPEMFLVGSMAEGTRAGDVIEIDAMLQLSGFKKDFLATDYAATELKLTNEGKSFFSKSVILS